MKVSKILQKTTKDTLVKASVKLLNKNPEQNVHKLFSLIEKTISKDEDNLNMVKFVHDFHDNNADTHDFILDILKNTDKKCMKKFFTNFFANAAWYGTPQRESLLESTDTNVPFIILIVHQ